MKRYAHPNMRTNELTSVVEKLKTDIQNLLSSENTNIEVARVTCEPYQIHYGENYQCLRVELQSEPTGGYLAIRVLSEDMKNVHLDYYAGSLKSALDRIGITNSMLQVIEDMVKKAAKQIF